MAEQELFLNLGAWMERSRANGPGERFSRPRTTSEIARAVGVHPNTVRLYEAWGFLPPIPRSPGGYRLFTEQHLEQMRLARLSLHGSWPGPNIRRSALDLVRQAASGDLQGALEMARRHLALVQAERSQAEAAAQVLEAWAQGATFEAPGPPRQVREVAALLDVTADMLRNWERNGLIHVPRDPRNRYRRYGPYEIDRLRIIRMLIRVGYSTMAVLRMLLQFDQGRRCELREVLDTPRPDEDILSASDRWLSTLAEQESRARRIVAQLLAMVELEAI